eukprot:CAMPEP_0173429620 /NCGR_PEP_ID=MMETSP1357-20121228/8278_1 /TAXON_ID=77926 /ORGANISM="Hemiselmis rufescens, Strain PCC563" /LENGTH=94 /DNA_ID=CAMNT_0014393827 /DNA_START=9 /DNA_END=293 /DNA_ORIENTATION=-
MVFTFLKAVKAHAQEHAADPQAEAAKAAKDMASILQAAKSKKKGVLHPNEMAALALTFHPHLAIKASATYSKGDLSGTQQLAAQSLPGKPAKLW